MALNGIQSALKLRSQVRTFEKAIPRLTTDRATSIDWRAKVIDLVPQVLEGYYRPTHLRQYGKLLDEAVSRMTRPEPPEAFAMAAVAAPPQHGKTVTTKVGMIKAILLGQGKCHMYVSYSQSRSDSVSRELRLMCENMGITVVGTMREWYVPATKAKVVWTSIGGLGSGEPVTGLLVIDDPYKDFAAARSAATREKVRSWTVGVGLRRVHRTTTIVEMCTRWHEADLAGWMQETYHCPYINIQGICENPNDGTGRQVGEALFPALHTLEMLELQRRASPFEFESQYQGRPRPMGDALFDEPERFDDLPVAHTFQTAYGFDAAYSERTSSDYNVVVRGRRYGDCVYVLGMRRKQAVIGKFLPELKAFCAQAPAPIRWYTGGGGEKGVAGFIAIEVPQLVAMPASGDKIVRSTNVRQGWNLKRVLLPSEASPYYGPWVEELRKEAMLFTGLADPHDDIVDALAALWDQLMGSALDFSVIEQFKTRAPRWSL